jgi:hypothetical protein
MILQIFPKAGYKCTQGKIDQGERRKARTEILMWLSKQSLELGTIFKEASRNFMYIFFAFIRQSTYLETPSYVRKVY